MSYRPQSFWVPKTKDQLVEQMRTLIPYDKQGQKINWSKYDRKQLIKIYVSHRIKMEKKHGTPEKESRIEKQITFGFVEPKNQQYNYSDPTLHRVFE